MPHVQISQHPLVQHKLTLLRRTVTEPKKFRELVRELAQFLLYEATLDLPLNPLEIETPLAALTGRQIGVQLGLVPILRAGLGMVDPILDLIPTAHVWHLGLYRDHTTLEPVTYYNKLPPAAQVDLCLVLDPMLATGGSLEYTCRLLVDRGAPQPIVVVCVLAAPEGLERIERSGIETRVITAAVDSHLNDKAYIVPGLGDAGDRQFGLW